MKILLIKRNKYEIFEIEKKEEKIFLNSVQLRERYTDEVYYAIHEKVFEKLKTNEEIIVLFKTLNKKRREEFFLKF